MKQAINIIIVSIASFLAGLLVFLGIRKVNIGKNKKYGLFISTLLIALSLAGCDILSQKTKIKTIPPKFPLKQLESQTAQNEIEQFKTEPSDRIIELNKFQEWENFKTFWKKLDSIMPAKEESGSSNSGTFKYYGRYYGSLGSEGAENLRNQLNDLMADLRKIKQDEYISSLEIDLLEKICVQRIDYMSNGFTSMLTRAIPSRTLINRENSIKELENKIDVLIDLQKGGKIDKEEFSQAIANIRQDIKDFSIIDAIYANYSSRFYYAGGFEGEDGNQDMAEKNIAEFEKHYNDYLKRKSEGQLEEFEKDYKDLDEKYIETKKAIEKIKNILPNFDEIVDDLVL